MNQNSNKLKAFLYLSNNFEKAHLSTLDNIKRFLNLVKRSLNGELVDYTQGSMRSAVFLLAIPMILELSLESVFAIVDMFFVSELGENAIATVGLTEAVVTIIYSLAIGISTAATAIISRRIGEKNTEAAAHAGAQALIIGIIVSALMSLLGIVFATEILTLMGASEAVIRDGAIFTQILLGGSMVIILLFLINGIFRGTGNPAMAMKSLWIASAINIILCPILISFFGLKGAAIATVIGRASGVLYQCYHLFNGKGRVTILKKHFIWDSVQLKSIVNIGWPAAFQFILASGSWIVLTHLVAESGGTTASAGYQLAMRCFICCILPSWGLSNAAATLVGQNLGANQIDRAEKSVLLTVKYNTIFMSIVTLVFVFFAHPIISFFTTQEGVVRYGTLALQIMGSGQALWGIGMVFTQALNGAGDTKTPTFINFLCFWAFQIPIAYFFAWGMDLKSTGAFLAIPLTDVLVAIAAWYYFKKGKWKTMKV
jgi:putative MATE family efflux protein